jgi:hypothetical protein
MKRIAQRSLFLLLIFLSACSVRKDTKLSRFWHRLNTRYNGYFNGNEALKEGYQAILKDRKDNYALILPVFPEGREDQWTPINTYAEKAIEKGGLMIKKHSMLINGKQRNSWIDDCYRIMAIGNYYKKEYFLAAGQFTYAAAETESEKSRNTSKIWLIRLYNQQKEFAQSRAAIRAVNKEILDNQQASDFYAAQAEYFILQNRHPEAIDLLTDAVKMEKRKHFLSRYHFILGQLHEASKQQDEAYKAFEACLKTRPVYAMEFQAQIRMANNAGDKNAESLRKMFAKMLKDDKNIEYRDQIYYALAILDLKEQKRPQAIDHLKKSIAASTENADQKSSAYLKLADLSLELPNYTEAQAYYDSCAASLNKEHPRYEDVVRLRDNLAEAVQQLKIIHLQDSLLKLAALPEKDRQRWAEKYVEQLQRNDDEAKKKKEEGDQNVGSDGPTGAWYFTNPQAKLMGADEFKKVWGNRPLVDNWRRYRGGASAPGDNNIDSSDNLLAQRYNPDTYLQELPLTDSAKRGSLQLVEDALFALAQVYKEKLQDITRSVETYTELDTRFNPSRHYPLALYQWYLNLLAQNQNAKADKIKKRIIADYPSSQYAQLLSDPNYLARLEEEANKAQPLYREAYKNYMAGNMAACLRTVQLAQGQLKESPMLHRFDLLEVLALRDTANNPAFIEGLKGIVAKHPKTESAETAERLLGLLGVAPAPKDKPEALPADSAADPNKPLPYAFRENLQHMVVAIVDDAGFNPEPLKTAISNFNAIAFKSKNLTISNTVLGKKTQLLTLRKFNDAKDAINYVQAAEKDPSIREAFGKKEIILLPTSIPNLGLLFKEQDVPAFQRWTKENYK